MSHEIFYRNLCIKSDFQKSYFSKPSRPTKTIEKYLCGVILFGGSIKELIIEQ